MTAKLWHAINTALRHSMTADPRVVLLGEDVGAPGGPYGLTRGLLDEFGAARVRDTPISEGALSGCAVGAAMSGLRPIVEIMFFDFMTLALDQLVNNAAKYSFYQGGDGARDRRSLPLVVRTLYGGRASMGPQHSQSLESWLCHVPGLKVAFPASAQEAYGVLRAAVDDPDPVIVIEPIAGLTRESDFDADAYRPGDMAPGKSRTVLSGNSVTVVSYGPAVDLCSEAIRTMGVDAELIDLVWLQPWDIEAVRASVERTNRLVIVHDAAENQGVGAEIAARIGRDAFWYLDAPITRVGARFSPIPVRKRDWSDVLPTKERIISAIREVVY
ncbi:alpha-ketoacid dehydrogenase subunit beta [Marivibrio halodurans]